MSEKILLPLTVTPFVTKPLVQSYPGAFAGSRKRRLIVLLTALLFASGLAYGDPRTGPWQRSEWTQSFSRSLTKKQCMNKTIATLQAGCNDELCLKNTAGLTGDCLTEAKGDLKELCANYEQDYLARYCISNAFSARQCYLLHVINSVSCKAEK